MLMLHSVEIVYYRMTLNKFFWVPLCDHAIQGRNQTFQNEVQQGGSRELNGTPNDTFS